MTPISLAANSTGLIYDGILEASNQGRRKRSLNEPDCEKVCKETIINRSNVVSVDQTNIQEMIEKCIKDCYKTNK